MIITNILHATGSKTDLYSSIYFKKVEDRGPINPFTKWAGGLLIGYGTYKSEQGTVRCAIDLRSAKESCGLTGEGDDPIEEISNKLTQNEDKAKLHLITVPLVPPSSSYTSYDYKREFKYSEERIVDSVTKQVKKIIRQTTVVYFDNLTGKESIPKPSTDEVSNPRFSYYIERPLSSTRYVSIPSELGSDLVHAISRLREEYEDDSITLFSIDLGTVKTEDNEQEHDSSIMGYWLGTYTTLPKYFSADKTETIIQTFGSHTEPKMKGDFEYRHALHDAVFDQTKATFNRETTLPICNGLCCFPRVIEGSLYASQGYRMCYNPHDRDRRCVLMDFEPVGGCSFKHLNEFTGDLNNLIIPAADFDSKKQTMLLVVDGRLYLPDEFTILRDEVDGVLQQSHLIFDSAKYSAIFELDRKLCRDEFVYNTRMVEADNHRDLLNEDNSFVVIINATNLQIIRHLPRRSVCPMDKMRVGSDALPPMFNNDFDRQARGLLFDETTRSVIDYTREEQSMTFYADKFRKWRISNISVNRFSLIALFDGKNHNLMSARGFVLDDVRTDKYNNVMWPKLEILDFVFRG